MKKSESQEAIYSTALVARNGVSLGELTCRAELLDVTETVDTHERVAILRDERGRVFAKRTAKVRAVGRVAAEMLAYL